MRTRSPPTASTEASAPTRRDICTTAAANGGATRLGAARLDRFCGGGRAAEHGRACLPMAPDAAAEPAERPEVPIHRRRLQEQHPVNSQRDGRGELCAEVSGPRPAGRGRARLLPSPQSQHNPIPAFLRLLGRVAACHGRQADRPTRSPVHSAGLRSPKPQEQNQRLPAGKPADLIPAGRPPAAAGPCSRRPPASTTAPAWWTRRPATSSTPAATGAPKAPPACRCAPAAT